MKQHKYNSKSAFTLVELIVVVIILAILWTIGFISLQWYGKTSRDSVRLSDLWAIKISLDLFYLNADKYPLPTDLFDVSYSGSEIWTQWDFWEDSFTNIQKLDKLPVDPLTEKLYTYSVTQNRQEYQIAGILESEELVMESLWTVYAWETVASAYVTWNYNEVVAKSLSGTGNCNLLSVPSIISNQPSTINNYQDIVNNDGLVYRWYKNLPYKYQFSKFKHNGWFWFTPNKLVIYTDEQKCSGLNSDIYDDDNATRFGLIMWIRDAYSGTVLKDKEKYVELVNFNPLDESAMETVWNNFLNNTFDLGLKVRNITPIPPVIRNIPNASVANGGNVNIELSQYVWFTNGDAITSYSLVSGNLPTWVTLNTTSWLISGAGITDTWVHNIWVTASDKDGESNEYNFSISIEAPANLTLLNNQFNSYPYWRWECKAVSGYWNCTKHYWGNSWGDYTYDNTKNLRIDFQMSTYRWSTYCHTRMNLWLIEIADMRRYDSCWYSYRPAGNGTDYIRLRTSTGLDKIHGISDIWNKGYSRSYQLKPTWEYRVYRNGSVYKSWTLATMPASQSYNMYLHAAAHKVTTSYVTIKNPVELDW